MKRSRWTKAGAQALASGLLGFVILSEPAQAVQTNYYYVVPVNGSAQWPYQAWGTAATNIQTAVDKAQADLVPGTTECVVLVSNGLYAVTNEITITNGITLRGFSGNWVDTTLKGGYPVTTNRILNITGAGAVVEGFTVTNGYSTASGGGVSMTAASTVKNCLIAGNSATGASSIHGGGISASAGFILSCTIRNNTAIQGGGGGVYLTASSTAIASNCVVVENRAGTIGGGILLGGGTVLNCSVFKNSSGSGGGGIAKSNSSTSFCRNVLIAGNQTPTSGGGVYLATGTLVLQNCTAVGNLATNGGGLYTALATLAGTNCIVVNNRASQVGATNDIGGLSTAFGYSCSPTLSYGVSNLTAAPLFLDEGAGFGTNAVLGDYALKSNSPCIGRGTNLAWMTAAQLDLAGNNRIRPAWGTVDMGAYEAYSPLGALTNGFVATPTSGLPPLLVTFTGETSGSTNGLRWQWIFGDGTTNAWSVDAVAVHTYAIRTNAYTVTLNVSNAAGEMASRTLADYIMVYPAIAYVSTNGAHVPPFDTWGKAATNIQSAVDAAGSGFTTVLVSNGVYTVFSEIMITNGITLRGFSGNWKDTVLKGGYPVSTNRILNISGAGALVEGFTVTNGNSYSLPGGGIYQTAVSTVRNCLVIGNMAVSAAGAKGGGFAVTAGNVLNCEIRNNSSIASGGGGGFFVDGGTVVVRGCLVTGNRATVASGGGIRLDAGLVTECIVSNNVAGTGGGGLSKANTAGAICRNSLIAGNEAGNMGGGVYGSSRGLAVQNCTIVGNLATNGGGIYSDDTVFSVTNCIVVNNKASKAGGTNDISGISTNIGYSCSPDLVAGVNSNVTADPMFVNVGSGYGTNLTGGNYHLKASSPCIGAGTNLFWMATGVDLDGEAFASPAMGAYQKAAKGATRGALILVR